MEDNGADFGRLEKVRYILDLGDEDVSKQVESMCRLEHWTHSSHLPARVTKSDQRT